MRISICNYSATITDYKKLVNCFLINSEQFLPVTNVNINYYIDFFHVGMKLPIRRYLPINIQFTYLGLLEFINYTWLLIYKEEYYTSTPQIWNIQLMRRSITIHAKLPSIDYWEYITGSKHIRPKTNGIHEICSDLNQILLSSIIINKNTGEIILQEVD